MEKCLQRWLVVREKVDQDIINKVTPVAPRVALIHLLVLIAACILIQNGLHAQGTFFGVVNSACCHKSFDGRLFGVIAQCIYLWSKPEGWGLNAGQPEYFRFGKSEVRYR